MYVPQRQFSHLQEIVDKHHCISCESHVSVFKKYNIMTPAEKYDKEKNILLTNHTFPLTHL